MTLKYIGERANKRLTGKSFCCGELYTENPKEFDKIDEIAFILENEYKWKVELFGSSDYEHAIITVFDRDDFDTFMENYKETKQRVMGSYK